MPLPSELQGSSQVTTSSLQSFKHALDEITHRHRVVINASHIDDLVQRSGDSYIWHVEPGAAYRESPLLRQHIDQAGISSQVRLAHGILGLIYALDTAFTEHPERPMRGIRNLRFVAPVFEGAHLNVHLEDEHDGAAAFEVTSDQLEPGLAITGHILYGAVAQSYDHAHFASLAQQQLFSLEEAIGALSKLIGLGVLAAGERVLYMGQDLELGGLVVVGEQLATAGRVTERRPGRRQGERVTMAVRVQSERRDKGAPLARGASIFLLLSPEQRL